MLDEANRTVESAPVEGSSFASMANALEVPPIHVDQVADAIVTIIQDRTAVRGPVGVEAMREVIGWHRGGGREARTPEHATQP